MFRYIVLIIGLFSILTAGKVQVLSAVKKDSPIKDATVIFQKTGQTSITSQSNSQGEAIYPNAFGGIDSSDTMMLIKKEGYSTLIAKCPCDSLTYALSPVMQDLDGVRIVLNWGANPKDLDSHLVYPSNHIFYLEKNGKDGLLDVDDTNSYGPETITILKKHDGQKYLYAVHDYSDKTQPNTKRLGNSNAVVRVYVGQTLIRTYRARKGAIGNLWIVFGIDENGAFHDIEKYSMTTLKENGRKLLKDLQSYIQNDNFINDYHLTNSELTHAKKLNQLGEKFYHQKRLEDAMYLFQEAINIDSEFGQAYSNLGLTYQKLGRNAEAIWANRKAIERAHGNKKSRVQASSYYNIARVYESEGKYKKALENFQKASMLFDHNAYKKGIKRMQERLH